MALFPDSMTQTDPGLLNLFRKRRAVAPKRLDLSLNKSASRRTSLAIADDSNDSKGQLSKLGSPLLLQSHELHSVDSLTETVYRTTDACLSAASLSLDTEGLSSPEDLRKSTLRSLSRESFASWSIPEKSSQGLWRRPSVESFKCCGEESPAQSLEASPAFSDDIDWQRPGLLAPYTAPLRTGRAVSQDTPLMGGQPSVAGVRITRSASVSDVTKTPTRPRRPESPLPAVTLDMRRSNGDAFQQDQLLPPLVIELHFARCLTDGQTGEDADVRHQRLPSRLIVTADTMIRELKGALAARLSAHENDIIVSLRKQEPPLPVSPSVRTTFGSVRTPPASPLSRQANPAGKRPSTSQARSPATACDSAMYNHKRYASTMLYRWLELEEDEESVGVAIANAGSSDQSLVLMISLRRFSMYPHF
ncbi:unnamed protein product [Parajaminaea phylloscopi]